MMEAEDTYFYHHTADGALFLKERSAELLTTVQAFKHEVLLSPEGQAMVAEKLTEAEDQYASAAHTLHSLKQKAATCSDDMDWWYSLLIEQYEGSGNNRGMVKKKRSEVYKWRMMQNIDDGLMPIDERQRFNLEEIKQIPVESLMPYEPMHRSADRWTYRCPLHNEKTPSFILYRSQNTWHCYGCSNGGTVIDLCMKINNLDFISACRRLTS